MDSNPWQVDSIQTFYCLKCPECMFFSQKEIDFKDHAMENHPMSYLLFGKSENNEEMAQHEEKYDMDENYENVPSTSINSNSLIDRTMIKKEFSEAEIKDNSNLEFIEMNDEYFVPKTNFKDGSAIVENEISDHLESSEGIKVEENSETVFVENLDIKEEYSEQLEEKLDNQKDPFDTFSQSESDGIRMKSETTPEILQEKKLYKCPKCDMYFSYLGIEMKNHIRLIHQGEKSVQCSICSESFKSNNCLKSHILHQHKREAPHLCSICDANFAQKSKLKKHKELVHKVHEEIKEFICNICNKAFKRRNAMKIHVSSVHEGIKPFKCESCGSSFAQKRSLDGHIKSVHE